MNRFPLEKWDEEWLNFKGLSWFGRRLKDAERRTLWTMFYWHHLPKDAEILDYGCGSGSTMDNMIRLGFTDVIGIDNSNAALLAAERTYGLKRLYNMDATHTPFNSKQFDLVYETGLLEHFTDFSPFVREMCRLSRKYVLLMQPDPASTFNIFKQFLAKFIHTPQYQSFKSEINYSRWAFYDQFKKRGFELVETGNFHWNEEMWILFERIK